MAIGDKTAIVMETTLATGDTNGIVQYATDDEAAVGAAKNRVINPFQLRNTFIQKNAIQQFQQLSLPMSSTYADTAGTWTNKPIPPMPSADGFNQNSCLIGDKVYTLYYVNNGTACQIGVRDLTDMSVTTLPFGSFGSAEWGTKLFTHDNELYMFTTTGAVAGTNTKLNIYRIDLTTKARTLVNAPFPEIATKLGDYPTANPPILYTQIFKASEFEYIIVTTSDMSPCYKKTHIFNFKTSEFTYLPNLLINQKAYSHSFTVAQKLPDGNILFAYSLNSQYQIQVFKIFMSNYSVTSIGSINLGSVNLLTSGTGIQLDNGKMLCITAANLPGGSNVFELDLENLTFDLNKFPKSYTAVSCGNFIVYNDVIMSFYTSAAYQYLPLKSTPAEDNPLVLKIFKGQKFSSLYSEIEVKAIPNQDEFSITRQQKAAASDLEIHLGQYDLDSPTPIIIESGV